ncbi:MAG: efflux RND transporter periplasmic adaptor subunit [Chlamydiae bacterium]|nr:efflux RND transporter periplasmic adaptor subunit [Chlamydiota bacterium]
MKNVLFIIFCLGLIVLSSCQKKKIEAKSEDAGFRVKTQMVQKGRVNNQIYLSGEIKTMNAVDVFSKIGGRVEKLSVNDVLVSENACLKKGEVFAVIDHRDLENRLKQAQSFVKVASSRLESAKINLIDKQKENQRFEVLFKEGAISQKQNELALSEAQKGQILCIQAQAELEDAMAKEEGAALLLEEAFIKAPISGVVSKKFVCAGNMVSPSSPIVSLVDMDELYIIFSIPEKILAKHAEGLKPTDIVKFFNGKYTYFQVYNTINPRVSISQVDEKGNYGKR